MPVIHLALERDPEQVVAQWVCNFGYCLEKSILEQFFKKFRATVQEILSNLCTGRIVRI